MLQSLLQVITSLAGSPQQLHAIVVHLPIAAAMIGLLMLVTLACSGGRSAGIRWTLVLVLLTGAATAFLAVETGEAAAEQLRYPLASRAQATLQEHEELAEPIWVGMLVLALLVACTATYSAGLRATMLTLATILGLALACWVGITAHHGGQLVYRYGVGVPDTVDNLPAPSAGKAPPPVERPRDPQNEPQSEPQDDSDATTEPAEMGQPVWWKAPL